MTSLVQETICAETMSASDSSWPFRVKFKIFAGEVKSKERPWSAVKTVEKILGDIYFDYPHVTARLGPTESSEGRAIELENQVVAQLIEAGWVILKNYAAVVDASALEVANVILAAEVENLADQARAFYFQTIPLLKEAGWDIDIDDTFPFRPVEMNGEWYANLDKTSSTSTDWFDLELGMMINGKRVNILPMLVRMLREQSTRTQVQSALKDDGAFIYVPLDDGQLLPVPAEKIRFIAQTLIELHDADALTDEGKLRLSAWQSTQLVEIEAAMQAAQMRWFGDEQIRVLGNKLKDFTQIEQVEPPRGLQCELRSYQTQGVSWLQFLRDNNLNGILADDMGLGKTIQTLSHILTEFESGRMNLPTLVVAPTSLMTNWRTEATKFAPDLKVLVLHGNERRDLFEQINNHHLILTTYPLLSRDKDQLLKHEYHMLVLDEAQVIKNPNTMAHRIVQQVQARHRLCLTGTPMENHLGELWSLFYFLMPGFLGDQKKFNQIFRFPIEKMGDNERRQSLARRVKPFMLRRTKQQVVSELPPKTEIVQNIELLPEQRALYESIRMTMHERVQQEIRDKGLKRSHIVILDALLKLRQVCCDPRLLKLDAARNIIDSAKMQFLRDTLPEMIEEKRQILLFSQFTSMLALIEEELNQMGISYAKLTGQTKDRAQPIDDFQSGKVSVFLISLKAGGTGLNLTAADTVIHFDPWWNPAVENQATDRAYRIGQEKPVFVYKLMTVGTVEEKIMAMQQRKSNLLSGIFKSNSESEAAFSPDDLEALFEPLS
ncbi:DEAD/DEAH box helicase [Candidatus Paracaedibacter symbiosus]|uniref:DEAD/DEAH box helicase n=1 Tax=Candidatus Paracaedibacter symbiosus TaxID=244582 RepID=UPI001E2AB9DB|nr:DEAD/DEAH box helicase [Candidatus Paracaedibacter symbiosus]